MRLNDDDHRRLWAYEDLKAWRLENTQKAWDSHGNDQIVFETCPKCGSPNGEGMYLNAQTGEKHCQAFCGRTRRIEPYRFLVEIIQ